MSRKIMAVIAALFATAPVLAHELSAASLTIAHPWVRETAQGQVVGGAYMRIVNAGKGADQLLSASSPTAAEIQFHTMSMDGGIMRMRRLPGTLAIPAGASVDLEPGGTHMMLMGLKTPLKRGDLVPVTLLFRHAGKVKVQFAVEGIGAAEPMDMHHGH